MSVADPGERRAAVVVNPTKIDAALLRDAVHAAAHDAGWGATLWFETTIDDGGRLATDEAVAAGATMVLAAGGDGTVRAVAASLRGSDVVLAVVPQGTGNLLARNLAVPLNDIFSAVDVAFAGETRLMDVGLTRVLTQDGVEQEHAFVVMAGIGLDADMIANANPRLKKRVGWLAYVDSGMRALHKADRFRIGYQFDGHSRHHAHISSILVGNCGLLPGNLPLFPDAELDDGVLDMAMLQPKTLFGWLDILRRIAWENRVLRRFAVGRRIIELTNAARPATMTSFRGTGVRIDLDEPRVFELDGDEISIVSMLTASVDPGSLYVRVRKSAA